MLPTAEEERITVRFVSVNNISKKIKNKKHCTSRLNEDEVGNPQHKGLWGLSVGFPSAGYSLHFISWLTRCVAIHLELLRSFDPPSLQALPLPDKNSALQLKSFCVQREDGAGGQAGDLWLSPTTPVATPAPPHQPPHPPHRTFPHLLGLGAHHSPWSPCKCAFCTSTHISLFIRRISPAVSYQYSGISIVISRYQ